MNMLTIDDLVTLAQEVAEPDPLDWESLNINPEQAYRLMAASMLEYFSQIDNDQDRLRMLLVTAVKLSVENFILNLKLLKQQ